MGTAALKVVDEQEAALPELWEQYVWSQDDQSSHAHAA